MNIVTIKEKIDIVSSIFGEGNLSSSGKNITVFCPVCKNSTRLDKKKKLSICLETGIYHCWVCETKGKNIAYLAKINKASKKVLNLLYSAFGSLNNKQEELSKNILLPEDFKLLSLDNRKISYYAKKYLYSRGLSDHDIAKYKIGTSNEYNFKNRVIFPSFDNNLNLNFYLARAYDKNKIKYKNCDFNKKEIVFNENMVNFKKPLILVEGVFDAVKIYKNVACILGSWLDESYLLFQKIVKNKTEIILALDGDVMEKTQKIAKNFSSYCINVKITRLSKKDIGDMSNDEVKKHLSSAKQFDNTCRMRYLINKINSGSIY